MSGNKPGSTFGEGIMNILTLEHIGKTLGSTRLLQDVTLGIEDHDRIGLIGVNGTGKSTVLAIVSGRMEPDEGQVVRRNGLRICMLEQDPVYAPDRPVLESISAAILQEEEYWNVEGEARAMLLRLGIEDPEMPWQQLSGGQKKRAALAAALLTPSDLLILDEPTNHLDHEMIEFLQEQLEHYRGALLMVTHDRYFLDEVTSSIWEIDQTRIYSYEGNYEKYLETKQERLNFALAAERKMAALYKQDLAWMMRGARARSTKQKAHIQRFEQLRDRDRIVEERNVAIASLPSRMGNKTIEIRDLSKAYGDRQLFHDFTYTFLKNDRIGIIGPNGCGKSTLLKIIIGMETPDTGSVVIGETIRIGYFGQEHEALEENLRVIDYIREGAEYVRTSEGQFSASVMCERFLFDADKQYAPVAKLSGGEKRRLYLLRILVEAPNVLILDEPTNDLDIRTLQILEDYLDHFAGIVLTVSHDRYFLDRVVNRIFSFEPDGTLWQSEGGYEEYRERTALEAARIKEQARGAAAAGAGGAARSGAAGSGAGGAARSGAAGSGAGGAARSGAAGSGAGGAAASGAGGAAVSEAGQKTPVGEKNARGPRPKKRLNYKEQREYDSLEEEIDALTQKSEELEAQMQEAAADYVKLAELTKEKEAADQELDEKIERFLYLQELVESFEKM